MTNNENFKEDYSKRVARKKRAIGLLCREIRLRHNLTLQQVSDRMGTSERSITKVETRNEVSYDLLLRLFHFYYWAGLATEEDRTKLEMIVWADGMCKQ